MYLRKPSLSDIQKIRKKKTMLICEILNETVEKESGQDCCL